jgi:hypothetical protein
LQAAEYLRCGSDTFFSAPCLLPEVGDEISASSLERWSSEPQLALAHRDRMEQSQRITVCLNSTVVDLELGERGGVVDEVVVHSSAALARIKAGAVILAAGGIETTRLLLAVQRRWPQHFCGLNGPLGRYYDDADQTRQGNRAYRDVNIASHRDTTCLTAAHRIFHCPQHILPLHVRQASIVQREQGS